MSRSWLEIERPFLDDVELVETDKAPFDGRFYEVVWSGDPFCRGVWMWNDEKNCWLAYEEGNQYGILLENWPTHYRELDDGPKQSGSA